MHIDLEVQEGAHNDQEALKEARIDCVGGAAAGGVADDIVDPGSLICQQGAVPRAVHT